jgi:hypothetical protein
MMFRKLYLAVGALLLIGYSATEVSGWEMAHTERQIIPVSVRNSPGGYRSYHFWHSGFHGGK